MQQRKHHPPCPITKAEKKETNRSEEANEVEKNTKIDSRENAEGDCCPHYQTGDPAVVSAAITGRP